MIYNMLIYSISSRMVPLHKDVIFYTVGNTVDLDGKCQKPAVFFTSFNFSSRLEVAEGSISL
jgi:hypothetical protein